MSKDEYIDQLHEERRQLKEVIAVLAQLLLESRINIGGDWRERRDAALAKAGVL